MDSNEEKLYLGRQAKMCPQSYTKCTFIPSMRKVSFGIFSQLIHSIVLNDSVRGQRRPRSTCANAQADLGLCYPHMPEDMFMYGTAPPILGELTTVMCPDQI